MKRLFLFVSLIIGALSVNAQFADSAQMNQYFRDTIKDRRPYKLTADDFQRAFIGSANLLRKQHDSLFALAMANFDNSPAKGITSTNITNWQTAYSWGNHAGLYALLNGHYNDPSFIDSLSWNKIKGAPSGVTETDPTVPSYVKTIQSADITKWNSGINSMSFTTPNAVYSSPVNFTVTNGTATGALSLLSQNAYSVFAVGASNATPSFQALTINHIPNLSTLYLQNQTAAAQTASGWINGSWRIGGTFTNGSLAADPTGVNGMSYYSTATNQYREYRAGAWYNRLLGNDAILNQYASAQVGSAWLNGRLRSSGLITTDSAVALTPLSTDLSNAANGWLWYNSTTGQFRGYRGGVATNLLGGNDGILNQYTSAQSANLWISGNAKFQSDVTIYSSAPSGNLYIGNAYSGGTILTLTGSTSGASLTSVGTFAFKVSGVGGNPVQVFNGTGNMGLNMASDNGYKLSVNGNAAAQAFFGLPAASGVNNAAGTNVSIGGGVGVGTGQGGSIFFTTAPAGTTSGQTANPSVTRMSIDAATGNVTVNNLNDATGVAKMVTVTNGVFGYQAIPAGGTGSGTVTSVGLSFPASTALSVTGSPVITSGTFAVTWTGDNTKQVLGDGSLVPKITNVSQLNNDAGYSVVRAIQEVTTGASVTISANSDLLINHSATVASFAVTLPASPTANQHVEISTGIDVTSLTISPNTSQTIVQVSAPTQMSTGETIIYKFYNSKWYRVK